MSIDQSKNYLWVRERCPVCGQGRQMLGKRPEGLVVFCEECETTWPSPEDAYGNKNSYIDDTDGKLELASEADFQGELENSWDARAFVLRLIDYVPQLKDLYIAHIQINKKLSPLIFLDDVTQFFIKQVETGSIEPISPVARILRFFEDGLITENKRIKTIIAVGFVDKFPDKSEIFAKIKGLIGPKLQKQLGSEDKI